MMVTGAYDYTDTETMIQILVRVDCYSLLWHIRRLVMHLAAGVNRLHCGDSQLK